MALAVVGSLLVAGGLLLFFWMYAGATGEDASTTARRRTLEYLANPEIRARMGYAPLEVDAPVEKDSRGRRRSRPRAQTEDLPAKGLKADLIRADLRLRPGEFWLISLGLGVGLFLLMLVSGRGEMMAIGLGGIGFYAPRFYVNRRRKKRKARFVAQLADSLSGMAAALRSGASPQAAFQGIAETAEPPIKDEFARLVKEVTVVGMPLEKALAGMVNRVQSTELEFVAIAVKVNQEVGGNLADILDSVGNTIREREKLQGKVKALVTQADMTIKFMTAMPIGFGMLLGLIQPQAMSDFTASTCGRIILAVAAVLIVVGYFVAKKMGAVKV